MIMHGFIQRKNKQTNKNHQIFFFSKTRLRFLARLALVAAMLVSAKRKKRLCLRILFVSPFHCVKPGAIISFGKLLLQHFFQQVLIFKYSLTIRNTHTHKEKQTHKTKQKQSTLKITPKKMNSTPFKLMHLSIVSNRILLLGLPEFKNGLKADVEVSLMLRTLKNSLFKCLQS